MYSFKSLNPFTTIRFPGYIVAWQVLQILWKPLVYVILTRDDSKTDMLKYRDPIKGPEKAFNSIDTEGGMDQDPSWSDLSLAN